MKEPSLTLARDIQRLWNFQGKLSNPKNVEIVRSVWRSIGERLVRLVNDPETAIQNLEMLRRELQRPLRTGRERRVVNEYYKALFRDGKLATYGTIQKKLEETGLRIDKKNLQRMNKEKLHLPMRGRGRPRKK